MMVDDFGSEKIETDGPIEGQQEKDAIADAIARGAQTAPEDQSRSTLHTGELQEGAVLNKPGQRGAAHFSEEPLRLEAQEVIAQTRRDPNIIETDAAPSEEQTAPVSAPLPQNDRGAIAPQNTVYPARNESGQADRFEDVSPANFRAAPVTAPSEITSNLAEDTRNTPEDDNETNHAPDGLTLSDTTVSEQQAGAVIGRLTVQDLNQNDTHSYTVSDDRFEVVDGALKLKDGIALDHEAAAQVDVEVTVTDAAGSAYTESFMINVTDTNDAVTGLTLETQTVAENARGAVVGQLTVADQDVADTHSYTVSDDRFEVVDGALKLKDGIALDHEAAAQVDVEVTVTDAAGSAYTESFMINVTDTNDAVTGLTLETQTVAENACGAVVGQLTVADQDVADTHSFTVSDDRFEVVDGALKLKDGIALDHEAAAQVHVEVTVTDAAGSAYTESFMINVTDTNDAVTGLTLETQTVAENARGAVVGQLTVADQDVADTHSYTVSDDRFEVVDGALKLKDGIALDHEAAAQVDVEVTVTDAAGSAHTESFAISVTDQADLSVSTGFQAKYFDVDQRLRAISDVDWDATPTHQELVSNINYTNSAGSFWEGGARDTFGAEISGTIEVETGGVYRFDLSADDGAQLFVNGQQVVDNDGLHGYRLRSGELELPPGSHHIEVRYFENYGHAGLKLEWDGPDTNGTEPVIAPDVSDAQTVSGMPIALSVSHPDTASGEPTDLILEGLPVGTLVEAAGQTFVTGSAGRVDITGFDGDLITVNPPTDFSGQLDAVVTMINSSDPSGGVEISQSIGIDVNPANVVAPSAQLVTGFSVDYIDMDQRIRNLNDVDWDAEPSYQDHRSEIDFQNSANSFWEGGSRDTFGVRIEGQITVEGGGSYEFFTSADDGVALYVNGERVINDDGNHGYRTRSGQIDLEPGTHNIEMRYFENYGHAGLKLEWQGPDTEGRETLQADQGTAIDVNGTLDVGIDLTGASPPASLSMTGLPANTILMSGDDALLTDGGPADLSGWNINALEISPPAGYEGTISGDIILSDTAFNGAQTTSINSYEIVVGNLVAAEYSDPGAGDPSPFGAETSPQSLAWDAVPEGRDEETDETSANNKDVLSEPVVVQVNGEVTQIGTDTYERVDW